MNSTTSTTTNTTSKTTTKHLTTAATINVPMTDSSQPKAFSIAVVGGGIGGLTLALGLLKYDHIDVQVYEAAHSFGEIGAGIAIGQNTQRALKLIGPHAWDAFKKHATPNLWQSHVDNFSRYIVVSEPFSRICDEKLMYFVQDTNPIFIRGKANMKAK